MPDTSHSSLQIRPNLMLLNSAVGQVVLIFSFDRELRHRKVTYQVQDPIASKCMSWDSNPGSVVPESVLLTPC